MGTCKLQDLEDRIVSHSADIAIELGKNETMVRSLRFEGVQTISVDGKGNEARFSGMNILSGEPATVVLKDCTLKACMGQAAIKKAEGKLKLVIQGTVELFGSNASFGPSSFGESCALIADDLEIELEKNAALKLRGGKTFASLFSEILDYAPPMQARNVKVNCSSFWDEKNLNFRH